MSRKKPQAWFSEDELHAEIRGQNPWWDEKREFPVPPALIKPFHRSAFYEALSFVDNGNSERAVMILGARRVGKTRILYQLINHLLLKRKAEPRQILFLSLDNPLFQFPNLRQLLEQAAKCSGGTSTDFRFIFIDEIQYKKDWAKWLKTFVQEPIQRRFVVTGSAAATIQTQGPDEGVGRWVDVHVPTMNFSEYLVLRSREVAPPAEPYSLSNPTHASVGESTLSALQQEFGEYLLRGGFPELAEIKMDIDSAQRLVSEDIAEKVLNRDMAALYGVRQLLSLKQIFLAVAFRSSSIIDRKKLSDDFQVSPRTVNQYLDYLQRAFLLRTSLRYSPTDNRVVKSHPKVYVSDSALRNAVLRRGSAILANPTEMGPVVETAVFNHVYAWAKEKLATVYYWRSPVTNREVDIVIRTQTGKLIPIEVHYRDHISSDDFRGLDEFMERFSGQTDAAYLVTKNSLPSNDSRKVVCITAPEFIWQLAWSTANPRVKEYVKEYLESIRIWKTDLAPSTSSDAGAEPGGSH